MKKFTLICSPKYACELDLHPRAKQELFKNCEVKRNDEDIVLYNLNSCDKYDEIKGSEIETVLAKKVDYLHNTYFGIENFEKAYVLKENELLQCIFEDMGAIEMIFSQSFENSTSMESKISGEASAKFSKNAIDQNIDQNMDAKVGVDASHKEENAKERSAQMQKQKKFDGRKKSKDELAEYIKRNNIDINGFSPDVKKIIEDYLENEEVNIREIEIKNDFSEFYRDQKELVVGIGANVGIYNQLSIVACIKANIGNIKKEKKEGSYSWKVIFKKA